MDGNLITVSDCERASRQRYWADNEIVQTAICNIVVVRRGVLADECTVRRRLVNIPSMNIMFLNACTDVVCSICY